MYIWGAGGRQNVNTALRWTSHLDLQTGPANTWRGWAHAHRRWGLPKPPAGAVYGGLMESEG